MEELPKDKKKLCDTLLDILIMAYVFGVDNVNRTTESNVAPNTDKMNDSIYKVIDGQTWEDRVMGYETIEQLKVLAETETHRIFCEGQWDCAVELDDIVKIWNTMEDEKVREEHWYLDGDEKPLLDYFYTLSGDRALYPSGFGVPSLDINCRCYLTYKKRGATRRDES